MLHTVSHLSCLRQTTRISINGDLEVTTRCDMHPHMQ